MCKFLNNDKYCKKEKVVCKLLCYPIEINNSILKSMYPIERKNRTVLNSLFSSHIDNIPGSGLII